MSDARDPGAGRRLAINLVGVVGIVFGLLPIVRYLLGFTLLDLTTVPYDWLRLEGAARFLPPAVVLVACIVAAYLLEQGLDRD